MTMADTTRLSVRVPVTLAARLDKLASASDRTRSFVAVRALESYCEDEEAVLEKIREGLADLDEGRAISHERVAPWLRDLARGRVRRRPRHR
jgi:predicted transcriptional regulator